MSKIIFCACVLTLLFSCRAKDRSSQNPRDLDGFQGLLEGEIGGNSYSVLDRGSLDFTDKGIVGSGAIRFKGQLESVSSISRFVVKFSLADRGTLNLISYSNEKLNEGIDFGISNVGDELQWSVQGKTLSSSSEKSPEKFDDAQERTLTIEVDNSIQPAQLKIWFGDVESGDSSQAVFNSQNDKSIQLQGKGLHWGLKLNNASIKSIRLVRISDKTDEEQKKENEDSKSEEDGSSIPSEGYKVSHLIEASKKGQLRFERLAIPGSTLESIKTWKTDDYIWVKVTYTIPTLENQTKKAEIILACHPHGPSLGCHAKSQPGPNEPFDETEKPN